MSATDERALLCEDEQPVVATTRGPEPVRKHPRIRIGQARRLAENMVVNNHATVRGIPYSSQSFAEATTGEARQPRLAA